MRGRRIFLVHKYVSIIILICITLIWMSSQIRCSAKAQTNSDQFPSIPIYLKKGDSGRLEDSKIQLYFGSPLVDPSSKASPSISSPGSPQNKTTDSSDSRTPPPAQGLNKCKDPEGYTNPCEYAKLNCSFDSILFNALGFFYCGLYRGSSKLNNGTQPELGTSPPIIKPNGIPVENRPSKKGSLVVYFLLILPLVVIFFVMLYITANDHLTPSLGLMSSWLRLSPTVAGVTLLAFGNGAPDFFTSLAGTEDLETMNLILGGAIGSGLFITCFVFGMIILAMTKKQHKTVQARVDDLKSSMNNVLHELENKKQDLKQKFSKNSNKNKGQNNSAPNSDRVSKSPFKSVDDEPINDNDKHDVKETKPDKETAPHLSQSNASQESLKPPSLVVSLRSAQAGQLQRSESKTSLLSLQSIVYLLNPASTLKHLILYSISIVCLVLIAAFHTVPIVLPALMLTLYLMNLIWIICKEFLRSVESDTNPSPPIPSIPLPTPTVNPVQLEKESAQVSEHDQIEANRPSIPPASDPGIGGRSEDLLDVQDLSYIAVIRLIWHVWWEKVLSSKIPKRILYFFIDPINLLLLLTIPPMFLKNEDNDEGPVQSEGDKKPMPPENNTDIEQGEKIKKNLGNPGIPSPLKDNVKDSENLNGPKKSPPSSDLPVHATAEIIPKITYTAATNSSKSSSHMDLSTEPSSKDILKSYYYVDRLRLVLSPFTCSAALITIVGYWGKRPFDCPMWLLYVSIASWVSFFVHIGSSYKNPPRWRSLLVFLAFIFCIAWIFCISDEIVNLFQGVAVLLPNISSAFLGLTLLSWGNSFGDLVVDVAIVSAASAGDLASRAAAFETAFTGVICGPLQNVMLSLSISLIKLVLLTSSFRGIAARTPYIPTDPVLQFSMALLLFTLLASSLVIVFLWKFKKITRWYGYLLILTYFLIFLPVVFLGGLGVLPKWNIAF